MHIATIQHFANIMATHSQRSLLLTLPLELRTKIYDEMLSPFPHYAFTIYHDRQGRKQSYAIYPSILRTNKQIHLEANSSLYDNNNIFAIDL